MPYCAIQSLYDGLFPQKKAAGWGCSKSLYLSSLSDAVILPNIVGAVEECLPSPMSLTSVWHFGGGTARGGGCDGIRRSQYAFMLSMDTIWCKTEDDDANIVVRDFWSAMQRHSTGRLYLNFAGHGEDTDLVRQAHRAEVYARLAAIKRTYDPTNLFRMNQNINIA